MAQDDGSGESSDGRFSIGISQICCRESGACLCSIAASKERRSQLAGTLSGGEQQMCAIGRGLMAQPELLMLDEPSLGLAPKAVDEIFEFIANIGKQGVTILLVAQ